MLSKIIPKLNSRQLFPILLIAAFIIVLLGAAGYGWWLYIQNESLKLALTQAKKTQTELQVDSQRALEENENLQKQLDKIQADALNYVANNTKLQLEKEALEKRIDSSEEEIKKKEAALAAAKSEVNLSEGLSLIKLQKEIAKLKAENKAIHSKLNSTTEEIGQLNSTNKKERSLLYYNLGVTYSREKLYDQAIAAFEKALSFNPVNPQAHYNLGLIYENIKFNPQEAMSHYQAYLEQSPLAADRDEVTGWIGKLQ